MTAYPMYRCLAGKTVLITGGATGIGAELVRAFRSQDARVTFLDVDEDAGAMLARASGATFAACDVTDVAALEACLNTADAVDVLVNNVAHDARMAAVDTDAAAWRRGLAVNLDAAFLAARACHARLKASGGVVINLSSINPLLGLPGMPAYVAAKGATNALTKALAREWGADGIRVNAISPGWVDTDRQRALWLTPAAEAAWNEAAALGRVIAPREIAAVALFLASAQASAITGQNIVVDAGRT